MKTTWNIIGMKRKPDTGLVFEVTYVMNFKLENKEDRHIGEVILKGDPESDGFIPFEDLTKETVIAWVQSTLDSVDIERIETDAYLRLQETLNRENNPELLEGLPWNSSRF
jgi:hypothetical protein